MFYPAEVQQEYFNIIDNLSQNDFTRYGGHNKHIYWDFDRWATQHDLEVCKLCNSLHEWGNKEDCKATVRFCLYCCKANWFYNDCDNPECVKFKASIKQTEKIHRTCSVCSECGRCCLCRKNVLNVFLVPSWNPSKILPMYKLTIKPLLTKHK